jgi:hypothetical protein
MKDELQNEKKSEPERINLAHADQEEPEVVGHASATGENSRLSSRGDDAGQGGEGRINV